MSVYERVNDNTDLGDLYHVLEKLLVSSDFFNQLKNEPRYFIMPDFTEDLEELLRSVDGNNEIFESDVVAALEEACVDFRNHMNAAGFDKAYRFDLRAFESKLTEVFDMLKPLVTYCLIRDFMDTAKLEAAKYDKIRKTTEQLNTVVSECVQAASSARDAVTDVKSTVLDYVNNKPASEENLDNQNIENVNEDLREAYDMANKLHMMANAIKDKESVNKQSDNAKRKKKSNRRK